MSRAIRAVRVVVFTLSVTASLGFGAAQALASAGPEARRAPTCETHEECSEFCLKYYGTSDGFCNTSTNSCVCGVY